MAPQGSANVTPVALLLVSIGISRAVAATLDLVETAERLEPERREDARGAAS